MELLQHYNGERPGVKANLYRLLHHGSLAGTGKLVILPVDQGFEHGPDASFSVNPAAYDPHYHAALALESGVSAYAAPLGMLEMVADSYAGRLPLILKLNSANTLRSPHSEPDQAYTARVVDALRLGCVGVGLTIYPGSGSYDAMLEEARDVIAEARSFGLPTVVWAYPRGNGIAKADESALDVISYSAHMAALIGAHIIKVKLPADRIRPSAEHLFANVDHGSTEERVRVVMRSAFNRARLVLFSGGAAKEDAMLLEEVRSIAAGGGTGSIIGRNVFQRRKEEAIAILGDIMRIYAESSIRSIA